MAQHRFVPFIPDDTLTMSTIDVAYDNSYGPGHYDGVCSAEKSDFGQTESESTFCSCGKNNQKRGSQASCQQHKDKKNNCPCVKENVCCSRKCKCRNCNNLSKSTAVSPPTKFLRCRCGETTAHRKDTGIRIVSCRDTEKKSKCPCLGSYQGCSDLCRCFNCENVHGTRLSAQFNCPRGVKKKKRSDPGYKRQRSCDFLATGGFEPSSGPWTNFECAVLVAVIKVLSFTLIGPTADNISKLFNYVVDSGHHSQAMPFKPSSKTMHQISGKLAHLERKKAVSNVL